MQGGNRATDGEKKDPHMRQLSIRLGIVSLGFALLFIAIVLKLLSIQVIDVETYRARVVKQSIVKKVAPGERGAIYDRNGILLAENIQKMTVIANPLMIVEADRTHEVATRLSTYFDKPFTYYYDLIQTRAKQKTGNQYLPLERSLPVDTVMPLLEKPLYQVSVRKEQSRYYLNLASQVVGVVDIEGKGVNGLEKKYDNVLQGKNGLKIFRRVAKGGDKFLVAGAQQIRGEEGISIELTLDADIQAITEDEIRRAAIDSRARGASGIVMDVRTGEILAMASYPAFDMNDRRHFRVEQERNRPLADAYDPGSTFKIVMAAAATEVLGMRAEDSVDAHGGSYTMFNRTIRDHEKLDGMTFRDAMVHSSNIVAALTAMDIGAETFYDYVTRFGFGKETGIGLVGEAAGIVRKPEEWGTLTLPWMGYGYSLTATPLQVLQAYAAIANDGVLMKPFIIRRFLGPDGVAVQEFTPEKVNRVVAPETARYVRNEYLKAIVEEGTGTAAAVDGVSVGGKTGTAQKLTGGNYNKGRRQYVSSFVGFFPVDKPRIAAIVVVDEPQQGYYASTVAAPAFSRISTRMLACSESLKADIGLQAPTQVADPSHQVAVPLLDGLRLDEAEELLKWNGLRLSWRGDRHGMVALQDVEPGSMVQVGSMVGVQLSLARGGADRGDRDVQ